MLRFDAKSDNGQDMTIYLHKHVSPYNSYGLNGEVANLTSTWQTFEYTFTASGFSGTTGDGRLRLGFNWRTGTFQVDDVSITPLGVATPTNTPVIQATPTNTPPAQATATNTPVATATPTVTPTNTPVAGGCGVPAGNLMANGDFAAGTTGWSFYSNGSASFSTCKRAVRPGAQVAISSTGSNIQLYQSGISLQAGVQYVLRFDAKSDNGQDMAIYLHKHGSPYNSYGLYGQVANLTSNWQTFEYIFTASGFSGTTGMVACGSGSAARQGRSSWTTCRSRRWVWRQRAWGERRVAHFGRLSNRGGCICPLSLTRPVRCRRRQSTLRTTIITKYYYFGTQRVAMAKGGEFRYLHGDHLGSTVMETNLSGAVITDQKYYAFGSQRDSGPVTTDHKFTGQKLDGSGLMYYNARYYDPAIGQFVSPDTLVPDPENVLAYNRYMYALGNPLKYSDPSGHYSVEELQQHFGVESFDELATIFGEGGEHEGLWGWYDILRAANDGDTVTAWNPHAMTPISGVFGRDASGSILINMGGQQIVGAAAFANYGGYSKGANAAGWGLEYGAYASNSPGFASHMMKPAMSGSQFGADARSGCRVWDCKALYYDTMSLGGSFIGDTPTPITVVGGKALDLAATGAGLAYTREQYLKGNATKADLTVNSVTAVGSVIPGIGEAVGIVQLAWDILDPLHPY